MNISMKKFKAIAIIATISVSLWAIFVQPVSGASTNVLIGSGGLRFSPTNTLISVNDSVIWSWLTSPHSTTSGNGTTGTPNGLWDSGVASAGHKFTNTFTTAGTFAYYCSVHFSSGMTGQVFVASSGAPPTLSITNPLSGTVFAAPANVTVKAGVTNGSGAIANVEFLQGTSVLANETTGPFSATANSLAAGSYTLTAIASDNDGFSATNSINISVVTPVTVSLTNIFTLSRTNFQFTYPANIGLNYVVQRSADLINWTSLVTNMASSNPVVFVDSKATNGLDFYRVGRLPNP
jgi:plastocyanin